MLLLQLPHFGTVLLPAATARKKRRDRLLLEQDGARIVPGGLVVLVINKVCRAFEKRNKTININRMSALK